MSYTFEITPFAVVVHSEKLKGARRYGSCRDIEFFVKGSIGKKRDAVNYHMMNVAISNGYRALDCRID